MSQYCIKQYELPTGEMKNVIFSTENEIYFAGYDFMGSAEWEENIDDAYQMDTDEAEQILKDLTGSNDKEEQTMKVTKILKVEVSVNINAMWFSAECDSAAATYDAVCRIVEANKILYPNINESKSHFMEIVLAIFDGTLKDYSNNVFMIQPVSWLANPTK